MNLVNLNDRKATLENSLKQLEQQFHIVMGHLGEVNFQIDELKKSEALPGSEDSCVTDSSDIQ